MEKYVLDTSVMLLAFSRNGGGKLHHLLEKVVAGKAELYFPRFLQYEIRNTFAKLGCDLQQISEYTESILFMEHVGLVKCIEENEALHQIALGFVQMESEWIKISYYDAIFHALATQQRAKYLTADSGYFQATKDLIGWIELYEG